MSNRAGKFLLMPHHRTLPGGAMHPKQELDLRKAMTYEAAGKLFDISQGHELLRYAFNEEDDQVQREFRERFGIPDTTDQVRKTPRGMIYAHIQYQMALCEACKDPEKEVMVNHDLMRIIRRFYRTSWALANVALMGATVATLVYIFWSEERFPVWAFGLLGLAILLRRFGDALYRRAY